MQRNSKDFAASLSAFMHACLPAILGRSGLGAWPLAGAGDFFALSLPVLARVFFFSLPGGWSLGPTAPGTTVHVHPVPGTSSVQTVGAILIFSWKQEKPSAAPETFGYIQSVQPARSLLLGPLRRQPIIITDA